MLSDSNSSNISPEIQAFSRLLMLAKHKRATHLVELVLKERRPGRSRDGFLRRDRKCANIPHPRDRAAMGHHGHDTHALPPQAICSAYEKYRHASEELLSMDDKVVDFQQGLSQIQKEDIVPVTVITSEKIAAAHKAFSKADWSTSLTLSTPSSCTVYEHKKFNGLRLYPSLLPPECQVVLLDRLLHRDLSNPLHKTNIQQDYYIPFPKALNDGNPASFFTYPQSGKNHVFTPINPNSNHKPLNTSQFLMKKLRWLTLGDQYNWNTRSYPSGSPTAFPWDIASLVTGLFDDSFKPESGVVLLYSPKDYMPVHRDVSEECQRGLASFSLGCDGLFIIARDKYSGEDQQNEDREQEIVVLRVRSGDIVQMAGETRFAWHAMPKVLAGTCPPWLENWPAVGSADPKEYAKWKGYMKTKRLNISCRQVWS